MHSRRKKFMILGVWLAAGILPVELFPQKHSKMDSTLLERGRATKISPTAQDPAELKLVSYNIRWRSGDELRQMIQLLKHDQEIGGAQVIGLQEVDRNRKRTGNTNTAKLMAEELGMHYAWAAPPATKEDKEEETGVAILSTYPISDVRGLLLAHQGPGGRRRAAIGATLDIAGSPVRVYSVHSETRIPVAKKIEQLKTVLQDLESYPKDLAAVVLGDFNTWEPDAVTEMSRLFLSKEFTTPFPNDRETFLRRILSVPISLKLDWIWLRGLQPQSYGIDEKICLSDHWPLWTVVRLGVANKKQIVSRSN
jgi:endonuclease/exonuclease/phosphatase family metal-dependent hydrolase